jgi:hypothetical protein
MAVKRIKLNEEAFRALVRGGIVSYGEVEILLADIGFHPMRKAVADAERGIDTYCGYAHIEGENDERP